MTLCIAMYCTYRLCNSKEVLAPKTLKYFTFVPRVQGQAPLSKMPAFNSGGIRSVRSVRIRGILLINAGLSCPSNFQVHRRGKVL